jgi:hypothetical protein
MTTQIQEKIYCDYLLGSSITVYTIDYKDIVDSYSQNHWDTLKEELISKGNDFISEDDQYAYFGINTGRAPHEYINLAWDAMIANLECVDHDRIRTPSSSIYSILNS